MIVHFATPRCPAEPGYTGAVPIDLWLMTLPGVFLGSLFGPTVARFLGARNVIWIFTLFLIVDAAENTLKLAGQMGETCKPVGAHDCRLWCVTFNSLDFRPVECNSLYINATDNLPSYIGHGINASSDDGDAVNASYFDGYYFDGMQHINLFSEPECCHGFGARYVPAQSPWPPIYVGSEARPLNERVAKFKAQPDGWVPSGAHRRTAAEDKRVLDATTLLPG